MIEQALYQYLVAQSVLPANQIHYETLQYEGQDTFIVLSVVDQARPLNIDNTPSKRKTGFQVDLYSNRFTTLRSLRDSVVTLLHGNGFTSDGNNVQICLVESEISDYEKETKFYRIALTINLYYD